MDPSEIHGAAVPSEPAARLPTTTDQCELADDRFTLISLDNYTGDLLAVRIFGRGGGEVASESLYDEDA